MPPELPEVECLVRDLASQVPGAKVLAAHFYRPDLREAIPIHDIQRQIVGTTVSRVYRRGKYIVVEASEGDLLLHLGMSGQILVRSESAPILPHTHALIELTGGVAAVMTRRGAIAPRFYLHFVDPRRFGRIGFARLGTASGHPWLRDLGMEPLATEDLDVQLLASFQRRSAPIKTVIMDSKVVVGVGNIYASEALFLARIHPQRPANALSRVESRRLAHAIQRVLSEAIERGGSTLRDYRRLSGDTGGMQPHLKVYDREGQPCPRCAAPLLTVRQGARSTYLCASCQK